MLSQVRGLTLTLLLPLLLPLPQARIRIVGEASLRCLGVEHVRILLTSSGSRELSVLYSSHPGKRMVT